MTLLKKVRNKHMSLMIILVFVTSFIAMPTTVGYDLSNAPEDYIQIQFTGPTKIEYLFGLIITDVSGNVQEVHSLEAYKDSSGYNYVQFFSERSGYYNAFDNCDHTRYFCLNNVLGMADSQGFLFISTGDEDLDGTLDDMRLHEIKISYSTGSNTLQTNKPYDFGSNAGEYSVVMYSWSTDSNDLFLEPVYWIEGDTGYERGCKSMRWYINPDYSKSYYENEGGKDKDDSFRSIGKVAESTNFPDPHEPNDCKFPHE